MKPIHCSFAIIAALLAAISVVGQEAAPAKCEGLPPGRHANLERMTAGMNLTCEQQLKIEPLLHEEESVSKPLQKFSSFSADERGGVMDQVKIAARRQIREQLKPEQQKWMDNDIESVKGGGKKTADIKTAPAGGDPLADEQALSQAVMAYSAFTAAEKKSIVLQVKKAARNDSSLSLTTEQQKKLDAEIEGLSK